jgi:hypothetical protein
LYLNRRAATKIWQSKRMKPRIEFRLRISKGGDIAVGRARSICWKRSERPVGCEQVPRFEVVHPVEVGGN